MDKSKTHFQKMYYFDILPTYLKIARPITSKNIIRVCYVDTDSIILKLVLTIDQEQLFYKQLNHIFDFSSLPKNHGLYSTHNHNVVGIFKDEMKGYVIQSLYTNSAKSYLIGLFDNTGIPPSEQTLALKSLFDPAVKLKGIPRYFQAKLLTIQDFKEAFYFPDKVKTLTYSVIRIGQDRRMYTFKCKKNVLNIHDSKRYVFNNFKDSLAHGHVYTRANNLKQLMTLMNIND